MLANSCGIIVHASYLQMILQLQSIVYDNPNYYSSADQLISANAIETIPYLDPVETRINANINDYELPPQLDNYEQFCHQSELFDDVNYEMADYPLPSNS